MDVDAAIRSRARTIDANELARRVKNVRALGMTTIRGLIEDAVAEAAEHFGRTLGAHERKRLLEEAEDLFKERLEGFRSEKAGLEAHAKTLQEQLARAQLVLEEERQRIVSADQFTVSDAGIVEIEKRLGRMLDRAVQQGGIDAQLEQHMRVVLAQLLDDEREKISSKAREAQNDRVVLLERKISRLASTLEETQSERDLAKRRAAALEEAGGAGLRNVIAAGIGADAPDRERRLELMRDIFRENQRMYAELAALGVVVPRVAPPGTPPADARAAAETAAPTDAAAPVESSDENELRADDTTTFVSPAIERQVNGTLAAETTVDSKHPHAESPDDGTESEVDPDDLPWSPTGGDDADRVVEISSGSGARAVAIAPVVAPPLLRRKASASARGASQKSQTSKGEA